MNDNEGKRMMAARTLNSIAVELKWISKSFPVYRKGLTILNPARPCKWGILIEDRIAVLKSSDIFNHMVLVHIKRNKLAMSAFRVQTRTPIYQIKGPENPVLYCRDTRSTDSSLHLKWEKCLTYVCCSMYAEVDMEYYWPKAVRYPAEPGWIRRCLIPPWSKQICWHLSHLLAFQMCNKSIDRFVMQTLK